MAGKLLAYGQLVRLSLTATAIGDALVGLSLAHVGRFPDARAFWLVPASLGIHHGAMALNDWADREADTRENRPRPIPRGQVGATEALIVAVGLMTIGVLCGFMVAPAVGAWMAGVALLAAAYDLFGRGPMLGPLLLGACRAGNLAAGAMVARSLGADPVGNDAGLLWVGLSYGMYVFGVSGLARLEDDEDPRPLGLRPQRALSRVTSGLLFSVLGVLLIWPLGVPQPPALYVGLVVALGIVGTFAARVVVPAYGKRDWTRADCGRMTGQLLRALLLIQAALALPFALVGPMGVVAVVACLLGYPLATSLRKVFPPT